MKRWQTNLIILAFVLSLALHFGTGIYVYLARSPEKSQPIEVSLIDTKEWQKRMAVVNRAKQIVEQSEKQINDEKDEKAKYLSRFDQKVAQETRAMNTGKFQNDAKQGLAQKSPQPEKQAQQKHEKQTPKNADKRTTIAENGDVALPKLSALKPQFHWENVQAGVQNPGLQSQTDDYLKDVQTGPQTLLSSREFVYYSYYSRIKERLRMFWEPKIKEKVTRLFMSGRHLATSEERITRLIITLDNSGKLIRVQVMGESGLKDLDDAAVEAFQAAAPFPNPPRGIVESDGTIKIRWDFILEA